MGLKTAATVAAAAMDSVQDAAPEEAQWVVSVVVVGSALIGLFYCLALVTQVGSVDLEAQEEEGMDAVLLGHMQARIGEMHYISGLIRDGADAFMCEEYKYIVTFTLFVVLACVVQGQGLTALAVLMGSLTSILGGFMGMKIATFANSRTTLECARSLAHGYSIAIKGGAMVSFSLISLGVLTLYMVIVLFQCFTWEKDTDLWMAVAGFSFGATAVALFERVGGGIFTKAADIGADLSGKVDFGLAEDDYQNPAAIADNVGDNVGGAVGVGSDLFASFVGSICAALVLESLAVPSWAKADGGNPRAMLFPLILASSSILVGIGTMILVGCVYRVTQVEHARVALSCLVYTGAVIQTPVVYFLAHWSLPEKFPIRMYGSQPEEQAIVEPIHCCVAVWLGIWTGMIIRSVTEHYTSYKRGPVKGIVSAHGISAATGVILGLAVGYSSCAAPVVCLAGTILVANTLAGPYGIALAALGMLSMAPVCLAIDAYDSIADNASGIAEMSGLSTDVRELTDVLGGAGAIGSSFCIGSAATTSLALLAAFWVQSDGVGASVMDRWYNTGLLLGAMLPYAFSAITMKSVGTAAAEMVQECRIQFPRIVLREVRPDYERCIMISTRASLKAIMPAAIMVVGAPLATGLLMGMKCTLGLLQGALVSGLQMSISMINTGGAWEHAKKMVVLNGVKGSEQYKNAVVGDTVGDPLKDVTGPSLGVLLNFLAITSLISSACVTRWSNEAGGPFWFM